MQRRAHFTNLVGDGCTPPHVAEFFLLNATFRAGDGGWRRDGGYDQNPVELHPYAFYRDLGNIYP